MFTNIAKIYVIVGGAGHTTDTLRQVVAKEYPKIETQTLSEAEIFNAYLKEKYNLAADYLECRRKMVYKIRFSHWKRQLC